MRPLLRGARGLMGALALFFGAALVPTVGIVLLPAAAIWYTLRRPEPAVVAERRRRAALDRIITLHLVAHRLPNTPANRAQVLGALRQPSGGGAK